MYYGVWEAYIYYRVALYIYECRSSKYIPMVFVEYLECQWYYILLCIKLSVFIIIDIYFLVVLLVGLDKRHSLYRVHIGIPLRLFVWYCVCRYLN